MNAQGGFLKFGGGESICTPTFAWGNGPILHGECREISAPLTSTGEGSTASCDDDNELPHLYNSMAITGLLSGPLQPIIYVNEAEQRLIKIAERWQTESYKLYIPISILFTSCMYRGVVSCDRFVIPAIAIVQTFVLDDLLMDSPNDKLLEEFGIDRSIRESPQKIGEFLHHLNNMLRQQEPLLNPTPIEGMLWEVGQDMRRLSNPEWFNKVVELHKVHHEVCVASYADHIAGTHVYVKDLESYTEMRAVNAGVAWLMMFVEFTSNVFLPGEVRTHPTIQQLADTASIHVAFVNDIYSYHKEVLLEGNPHNLIKVLMDTEGTTLPQATWRAVELVNSYTSIFLELEKQLPVWESETWTYAMCRYVEGVKALMFGNLVTSSTAKRYRHPDSVFPELRVIPTDP